MEAPSGPIRRVLVLGSGGSGKTTFARRLGADTGLPVLHLDLHFWQPGWVQPQPEQWARTVDALIESPAWVMDGNYSGTLDTRASRADALVFLDVGRVTCIRRILTRRWRHRNHARDDLPEGCPERVTFEFLRWVWDYPRRSRPRIRARLARARSDQRVYVARSPQEVESCLSDLGARIRARAMEPRG